jgi:hypothetical protein
MKKTKEQVEAFLSDLQQVYEKHGIIVDSCGCCSSPWLVFVESEAGISGSIDHLREHSADITE